MPEDVKIKKTPAAKPAVLPFGKRKQLEKDIEHITEEMYKRNKELADTNRTLSLLQTIDAIVLESHANLKMVCEHITEAITQAAGYAFVGLFTKANHSKDELVLYGWSGTDFLGRDLSLLIRRPVHLEQTDEWLRKAESSRLLPIGEMTVEELAKYIDYPEESIERVMKKMPLKSLYQVKLVVRRHLVGVLVVGYYAPPDQLGENETLLIDRLSESIGVALDNKLLFEENQHIVRQLRESNAKLRALDEAKDDFVSMASHQLRTPLTSVKGYVSMVLEGDAGKINEGQRKLLTQSYYSSQRMVYLIADLLNVSRLRTGKFVINNAPVNLANVVEEEIAQLKETATNHNLKLTYDKPKDFPELMLDETKIRQIVMNFSDNAIYYTPSGGHINIRLLNNPNTVELRVEDDGIGVPKSEQHHLFTKFYRAGNAREARPDGTGLGLFMAKKVIVAQGGALIFESKQGKGSTFGFVFSKTKMAVPQNYTPGPSVAAARTVETPSADQPPSH
jgi:signal transduction histidine kinase